MLGALLNAAILSMIMHAVAKHEADYEFNKIAIISIFVSICNFVVSLLINPIAGLLATTIVTLLALRLFCYIGWKTSGIITGIFVVVQLIIGMAFGALFSNGGDFDELDSEYSEYHEN